MDDLTKKSGRVADRLAKRTKSVVNKTSLHVKNVLVGRLDNVHRVRGRVVGWVILMISLIFLAGLQFLWYRESYETSEYAKGGAYAEATLGKINTLNPLYAVTNSEQVVAKLLFSSLYSYDRSGGLKGDLARLITANDDGTEYVVTMRETAKWHDGENVTADDVIFTLGIIKSPGSRSTLLTSWRDVEVEKLNDYEVKFTLPSSYAAFADALTFPVLPRHLLATVTPEQLYENDFGNNPVGSGPYEFKALRPVGKNGERVVHLAPNSRYYLGAPKIERFLVHAYIEKEDIIAAMKTSSVSATAELDLSDGETMDTSKLNIREAGINSGVFVFLNTKSAPLKDVRVRQALQKGIDMGAVRSGAGGVRPLDLPMLNSQIGFEMPVNTVVHDIDKAKSLIKAAGYKLNQGRLVGKDDEQVRLRLATIDEYAEVAETLEQQLIGLGYAVDTTIYSAGESGQDFLQEIVRPRNYDLLIYEVEMGADPDMFAYYHSTQIGAAGLNLSNYSSLVADDILLSARATMDEEMRDLKYEAFLKLWLNDVPAIGVYQSMMTYYYGQGVRIFSENNRLVAPVDRFADVTQWAANRQTFNRTP